MSSEWTLHTGGQGEEHSILIRWFNENNVQQFTKLVIAIDLQDKPRLLHIRIDDALTYTITSANPPPREGEWKRVGPGGYLEDIDVTATDC